MEPFQWTLQDGGKVAGIASIPSKISHSGPRFKPLIVALHGGGYDSRYFDAHPSYTAANASRAFNIPFIAIDRACYGRSSSILPIAPDSDFCQESARWLHEQVLPLLWEKYGAPASSICIVLLCHSLGTQCGIPAAAMHARDLTPRYPLGGIIASGLGHSPHPSAHSSDRPRPQPNHGPDHILNDAKSKDSVMFAPGTVDPAMLQLSESLNHTIPVAEVEAMFDVWIPQWRDRWAKDVSVPVMFALVEHDKFFEPSMEHLEECKKAFTRSPRVDISLVEGAPHCMELSYWSQGWYAQCFGFAMQCAAARAVA